MPDDSHICPHCGQPLPQINPNPEYGRRPPNKVGIAVTIGVHVALVLLYLLQPQMLTKPGKLAESVIVFLAPPKAKPREQAPKPAKPVKALESVKMARLPNTITVPLPPPTEEKIKPEPKPITPVKEMDMQAYIEARKRERGAPADAPSAEQAANEKALRNINANIARANAAAQGDDGTGGIFSITNQTFHSADLKFRGWNANFKRRWLSQVTVEKGAEKDLETAIVNKMIEIIRKEKKGDFEWDSERLHKVVTMSARVEDTASLREFLYQEMFPKYRHLN